ncbi:MAG TPA: Ig-like domain repeat protein, partial [Anaeromyxobacter sp.]|nr:Ig-like domain repeat protein [Anaeromyxobacter sp.]
MSMRRHLRDLAAASTLLLLAAACARKGSAAAAVPPPGGDTIANAFANGDFESDAIGVTPPTGWTVQTYVNSTGVSGTTSAPPASFSALRLTGPGAGLVETFVVGGAGVPDPDLGAAQAFRFPAYGVRAARVNYKDATDNGRNRNSNLLRQAMTVGLADVDPTDGLIHVRFAVAPVVENPAHSFSQQPYYFVELLNLTRGTKLYGAFNVAGQAGVPWKTTTSVVTGRATQWLDWQLVDIAPGSAALAVGDQVQLTVLAAGCSLGGHFARVYVDGIGATIPGPFAWATAQASVHAGTSLTYTVHYSNGGTAPAIGARVDFTTPPQTTFASVAGVTGCTSPAAGSAGTLSCPLGTLQPGATGSFTVTVNVSATATGSIVAGSYAIAAVNAPTLLGAKVTTTVIAAATSTADVNVAQTVAAQVIPSGTVYGGATPLYTLTLSNPTAWAISSKSGRTVTLTDVVPAGITGVTWTCTASGGNGANASKCRDGDKRATTGASGAGNTITLSPRLSATGGQIVIQVFGTVSAATGTTVTNTASIALNGITDPNPANNTATASFAVGTPVTLTLTKSGGNGNGIVTSAPAGLSCGTSCGSAAASFVTGSQVVLTKSPQAGATFAGWSGTGAPPSCTTGAPTSCAVSMDAARAITATFTPRPAVGAAARVYAYSGNGQLGRSPGTFSAPLVVLVTDANGLPVSGATVSFSPPASGATASIAATASTNGSGLASVTATPGAVAGSYAVGASVSGAGTATFTMTNAGPPAHITYVNGGDTTDPQSAPVATAFAVPLLALVTDAAGNVVPGATATFTVSPAGGASATLSNGVTSGASVTATADANGFVGVTATANGTSGAYTVNATAAGVATPATFHLQNATSTAAEIFVASGSPQTTAPSGTFAGPLVVAVADAWGNAVPGVTVTFTAVPAAGATATLSNGTTTGATVTATTDADGLAGVTATAGVTGGAFTVSASAPGVPSPAVFSLVVDGGQILLVASGSPQSANVGAQFAALQVQLLDADGDPVPAATIRYTAPGTGATATLSAATAATDVTGLAGVTGTAAVATGSYQVVASTPNAPAAVSFSLTNLCSASTQCPASAPICDGGSGACGTCTADAQCATRSVATPYCSAGACVACTQDSQCGGTTPVCDSGTSSCAPCTRDAQCAAKSAATPVCNVSTGACSAAAATVILDAVTLAATYDGTPKAAAVTTTPGGLAVSVTYDGSGTPPTHAGSYAVVATVTTEGYQGSGTGTLVIARAPQTVSFTPPARVFGDAPFDLATFATGGGSGNPIAFTVVSGPGALTGTTLTLAGAGDIVLDASQAGSADYDAAPTVRRTLSVSPGATSTTLSAAPSPSVAGASVTFTVAVAASEGTPTGTVTVRDGAATMCTATLSGGAGACSASTLGVGSHELTASYGGDASFAPSASAATTLTVGKGAAGVALAVAPGAPVSGEPVTWTATVTATAPSSGTPSGTVELRDGETLLCAITLSGGAGACTRALGAGRHTISATYGGSASFETASSSGELTVAKGTSRVSIVASPAPAVAGLPVTFTASLAAISPASAAPTGTVDFTDGATTLCAAAPISAGQATCATDALAAGEHTVAAAWAGDAELSGDAGSVALTVQSAATSTALGVAPSPARVGQEVTLTATVSGADTPGGVVHFTDGETVLCAGVALSGGVATCVTSGLAFGTHALDATYAGDGVFSASAGSASLEVQRGATTLTVAGSPASSARGQAVTFTATVQVTAPAAATPTGDVVFTAGATILCTAAALSSGEATCTTSALTVGDHSVTATWAGDASLTGSSGSVGHTVRSAASTTTLAAAPSPARAGQPVTLTATVAGAEGAPGTPAGTVTFQDGATTLCAARPLEDGAATCSTAALGVGVHTLGASYSGDASFAGSSGAAALEIEAGAVAVTVASAPAPARTGEAVTFTATVSAMAPATGVPTGTVTFTDGATTLCAAHPLAGGVATCATSDLAVGTHHVTATYAGDARFLTGAGDGTLSVQAGATSVALDVLPGAPVSGELVTFVVTVSPSAPAAGAPSGEVDVWDGTTFLCTAVVAEGAGSCTAALGAGDHALTLTYGGGPSWNTSTRLASVAVVKGGSTLSAGASPSPSTPGQPVTFTATVHATAPAVATPGGTVSFDDGATTLCAAAAVVAGEATCTVSGLGVGVHAVTATWSGDDELTASSADAVHAVQAASSTLQLAAAPSPARTGQAVTLTATVAAAGGAPATPGGTVRFSAGDDVLCAAAALSDGVATCTTSALAVASHGLTATYSGDGSFDGATGVAALAILAGGVEVTVGASPAPSVHGEPVTFTATVAAAAPAAGTPTGTVTFAAGGTPLCTARPLAGGAAACAIAALALGAHTITATYAGDPRFLAGDGSRAHEVGAAPGTIEVASSRNPSRAGRPITFTASVHYDWTEPAGAVTFRSGDRVLGTAPLSGGRAAITVRDLPRGTHPLVAEFAGGAGSAAASGALDGGQVVENTPPVAGAGIALALGSGASRAAGAVPSGALDSVQAAELWFRADDGSEGAATLFRAGTSDAPALALGLQPGRAGVEVNAGGTILSAAAALDDGRWHHVAVSEADGMLTVLLDGAPVATGAASLDLSGVQDCTMGEGLSGALDEVRLWDAPRSAAAIAAHLRRPVRGDAAGLAALWRFDEGSGAEVFDAGPAGLDLAIDVQDGAAAFAPSVAWRDRIAAAGAAMAPVDAGYDADGDPLALTLAEGPAHGAAAIDADALQVGYTPSAQFGGVDTFTLRLDDGIATTEYGVRVLVSGGDLTCRADAECGPGAACVRGTCTAVDGLVGRGDRTGCSSPGTPASLLGLAFVLLLLRPRRCALPEHARRAHGALLLLVTASLAGPARAETPAPIPVENYAPAPPGDPLFTTPAADVPGHLVLTGGVALSYARAPLVLERNGERVEGGVLVQDQLWGFFQASIGAGERLRLDGALPLVIAQGGQKPFANVRRVSRSSLGDLRLGGQAVLGALGPVRAAAGLDLWFPSGVARGLRHRREHPRDAQGDRGRRGGPLGVRRPARGPPRPQARRRLRGHRQRPRVLRRRGLALRRVPRRARGVGTARVRRHALALRAPARRALEPSPARPGARRLALDRARRRRDAAARRGDGGDPIVRAGSSSGSSSGGRPGRGTLAMTLRTGAASRYRECHHSLSARCDDAVPRAGPHRVQGLHHQLRRLGHRRHLGHGRRRRVARGAPPGRGEGRELLRHRRR